MRHSIQNKILISFSIIIFIGLLALLLISYNVTEQNINNTLKVDMIETKKNLDQYIQQYFLINGITLNKDSLESEADALCKQLVAQTGNPVDLYDWKGNYIPTSSSYFDKGIKNSKDFKAALAGNILYSSYSVNKKTMVRLCYPIEADNSTIGILVYAKDYSQLFDYSKNFKAIINSFAAIIFIIIFIMAFILSRQITKPIKRLSESSERVSNGDFDFDLKISSRDEIGELTQRFKYMVDKIKQQIEIIEKERDNLKLSQDQNKVFFDNVTHELKTPITTIKGYAQALAENGFTEKDFFQKGINYIIKESERLDNLVIELLELSTSTSKNFKYRFESINLSELIISTCDEMRLKGKKYNIAIECSAEPELCMNGDKDRLREVLINLIDNSMKYGNVNSVIDVKAYCKDTSIFLSIKDYGEGIPEEYIKNVFQPFYRVSKKASRKLGSAGLGLTICKEIVDRHGGTINIASQVGKGTEVFISFKKE